MADVGETRRPNGAWADRLGNKIEAVSEGHANGAVEEGITELVMCTRLQVERTRGNLKVVV